MSTTTATKVPASDLQPGWGIILLDGDLADEVSIVTSVVPISGTRRVRVRWAHDEEAGSFVIGKSMLVEAIMVDFTPRGDS